MALTKVTGQVIKNTTDVTVGVLTVTNTLAVGGTVSIGGTLTYEDVTNVDAVGLITARNGIVVGSGITLSKDGDVFFTGIATGNGSGLTALNASNIGSGTVPTARLGSGTASSSTFLRGDSTFQTVVTDLVNDTSPQLGGDLDTNSFEISLDDSHAVKFGDDSDFTIAHDGSNARLINTTGNLQLFPKVGEYSIVCIPDAAVELYHNNSKKFETSSTGAAITGNLSLSADDPTLNLIDTNNNNFAIKANTGTLYITDATNNATRASMTAGGNWTFNHNVTVTGTLTAGQANLGTGDLTLTGNINLADSTGGGNNRIIFGASDDFQLWHDGSHSYIADEGTGNLRILTNSFTVNNAANSENMIQATQDGAVQLYYDNSLKAATNADGFRVSGALQSSSGTGNYYLRTKDTTIQEGGNSVTITLTGLTFGWGVFRLGGYASAGQGSAGLHIVFGGYMATTSLYGVDVLQNHVSSGTTIGLTKNATSYVITVTNNAANYDLFCNMMIESPNSAFTMTLS